MTERYYAASLAFAAESTRSTDSNDRDGQSCGRVSIAGISSLRRSWLIGICTLAVLSGCVARDAVKNVESPVRPDVLASSYTATQKIADEGEYQKRILEGDLTGARVMRDIIVQSVRREIEVVYQAFEAGLFANRAAFDVETDIFELLLSTATTLTGAERARTNLSALLTGTKGARLSVDKNVFGEKTYSALVSQMRASRSTVTASMVDKLAKLDVNKYPLAEAELDLVQLFNAGTIHEALVQLSTQAGKEAKDAAVKQADVEDERLLRQTVTSVEVKLITAIRTRFNQLFRAKDIVAGRAILQKADATAPNTLSDDDVWIRLDGEIRKAGTDPARLKPLAQSFGIGG